MSDENEKDSRSILMFNPYKFWKNVYFAGEDSLSSITRKAVETNMFANGVDLVLNAYLQYLRMQKELTAQFTNNMPFASRWDMARVAKLVVSLENKVDRIEEGLFDELAELKETSAALAENIDVQSKSRPEHDSDQLQERFDKALDNTKELLARISGIEEAVKEVKAALEAMNKEAKPAARKTRKSPAQ